jgi:hypothetical protein
MDKKEDNPVRVNFRNEVFKRDKSTCVVPGCDKAAVDAHHIIERALWKDPSELGGYFKENGASLCTMHHIDAEQGFLTPTALRMYTGVHKEYLPKSFVPGLDYDKWGRELKSSSRWSIKYPHTSYLTISLGFDPEDVREGKTVNAGSFFTMPTVITRKMDGSNIFFDSEKVAARNGHDATHASFDMAKALHAKIRDRIPEHIQIFCEWLYAKHSIHYTGNLTLDDYCQVFAVYDRNTHEFFSWRAVELFANGVLGMPTVPVMSSGTRFVGQTDFNHCIYKLGKLAISEGHEGIVVRNAHSFHYSNFWQNVGKFVRPNHVSTNTHWMNEKIIRNEVKSS